MRNLTLFSLQQKHAHGTSHLDNLSLERTFQRVVSNFIKNQDDSFNILETIVLCCILIEAIVRENLKEINPALILDKMDPISIAILSDKKDKLLEPVVAEISDIKTANFRILLGRYLIFYNAAKYKSGIESLFDLRNKILHAAPNNVIEKHIITLNLTRSIFPFIKEHVNISIKDWNQIEKIRKVSYSSFKSDLTRNILAHKNDFDKLTAEEINSLISESPTILSDESIIEDNLLCPACKHNSVTLVSGVDFDWNPDGQIAYGYYIARCRVCEIEFNRNQFEEIAGNPNLYFDSDEDGWENLIEEFESSHYEHYL